MEFEVTQSEPNIFRLVCVGGESRRQSESGLTNAKANNKQQHP